VSWLARVGIDGSQSLNIELCDALPRSTRTNYTRALGFEESDAPKHRWSTVGVVVAALVISAESGKSDKANEPRRAADATPPPGTTTLETQKGKAPRGANPPRSRRAARADANAADATIVSEPPRAMRVDVLGQAGPAVEGLAARYGGALRPSLELDRNLFVWSQFSGSRRANSLSVNSWGLALGLGYRTSIVRGRLDLDARVGTIGTRVDFEVGDAEGNQDSATQWRYGALGGLDAAVWLVDSFGLFVGVDVAYANPRVRIRQSGNEVGQLSTVELLALAGLRWRIPVGHSSTSGRINGERQ
jgi:hypothetical protein